VEQCDSCKFYRWRDYTNGVRIFECRYSDPALDGKLGKWPVVQPTDWCGKWVAIGAAREERALGEVPL
jgi:hypothetical protein